MSDYIFSINFNKKTNEDIFYSHKIFKKNISKEDFFCFQRDMLKKKQEYRLIPKLKDGVLDTIAYFYQKAIFSRQNNWESDFGRRVQVKAEFIETENLKKFKESKNIFPTKLSLKVWIFDEETGKNLFKDYLTLNILYSYENYKYWNFSADYIAILIQNAINGNLQTVRDLEKLLLKENEDLLKDDYPIFECDECKKVFTNLNSFFCHLLEENHYDSLLDEFPNDNEVQRLKNVLKKDLAC